MSTPLSRVIQSRLGYLELTKDQLAERSGLGRSTIYAFVAGTRTDPQGSTLRKLADGLRMTPAQLLQAVNGTPDPPSFLDARIARIMELLPSIPKDRLDAIEQHVTLAVQPVNKGLNPRGLQNGRTEGSDTGHTGRRRNLKPHTSSGDDTAEGGRLPSYHRSLKTQLVNAMAAFGRALQPSNALTAEPAR